MKDRCEMLKKDEAVGAQIMNPDMKTAVWCSKDIFKGRREVIIEHDEINYRLIITKSGKLILNK